MNRTKFFEILMASGKIEVRDPAVWAQVHLESLYKALTDNDWKLAERTKRWAMYEYTLVKADNGDPLTFPVPPASDFADYGQRVAEVVTHICEINEIANAAKYVAPVVLLARLLGCDAPEKPTLSKEAIRDIRHDLCEALGHECGIQVSGGVDCCIDRCLKRHLGEAE